jgi:hypothetical protein
MPPGFTRSCLGGLCSLVSAGFPVAPEGFNAVLGQLARWFYPFGSGAYCNNYYQLIRRQTDRVPSTAIPFPCDMTEYQPKSRRKAATKTA